MKSWLHPRRLHGSIPCCAASRDVGCRGARASGVGCGFCCSSARLMLARQPEWHPSPENLRTGNNYMRNINLRRRCGESARARPRAPALRCWKHTARRCISATTTYRMPERDRGGADVIACRTNSYVSGRGPGDAAPNLRRGKPPWRPRFAADANRMKRRQAPTEHGWNDVVCAVSENSAAERVPTPGNADRPSGLASAAGSSVQHMRGPASGDERDGADAAQAHGPRPIRTRRGWRTDFEM
jgi:hypothetical protein